MYLALVESYCISPAVLNINVTWCNFISKNAAWMIKLHNFVKCVHVEINLLFWILKSCHMGDCRVSFSFPVLYWEIQKMSQKFSFNYSSIKETNFSSIRNLHVFSCYQIFSSKTSNILQPSSLWLPSQDADLQQLICCPLLTVISPYLSSTYWLQTIIWSHSFHTNDAVKK